MTYYNVFVCDSTPSKPDRRFAAVTPLVELQATLHRVIEECFTADGGWDDDAESLAHTVEIAVVRCEPFTPSSTV